MARVRDKWTVVNPEWAPKSRKPRRIPGPRWGQGKRWLAIWDENGKETTLAFDNQDAAQAHLEDVGTGKRAGTHITKDKAAVTVREMADMWIATKSHLAPKSIESYERERKRIVDHWGDTPCIEVRRVDVELWINSLTTTRGVKEDEKGRRIPQSLSGSMRRAVGISFDGILDVAEDQGVIPKNPLDKMRKAVAAETSRRFLEVDEVDALLKSMPTPESRLVVHTLVMTGLRPGECFGLQVGDLHARRGRLRIQRQVDQNGKVGPVKAHQHRDVPVGGDLLELLVAAAEGRKRGDWLLTMPDGRGWARARWRLVWEELAPGFDTYDLRHTAASFAIHAGANVKTVQAMLGHRTAVMTLDRYGHLWGDQLDAMPARLDAHMAAERERFAERAKSVESEQKRNTAAS